MTAIASEWARPPRARVTRQTGSPRDTSCPGVVALARPPERDHMCF
eukprot:CAMPEP_0198503994 /NCGR_PEP_ID=MMETSP1462-20131121/10237_1 /TAXON_ID=1333877 /ORGANISM="Brandtodinium nutriculum, Strain RCC3387" /LENGTH=45 /DNA_ID= /DNA_START= /DNA_END= /DNA_ORIENTATION=